MHELYLGDLRGIEKLTLLSEVLQLTALPVLGCLQAALNSQLRSPTSSHPKGLPPTPRSTRGSLVPSTDRVWFEDPIRTDVLRETCRRSLAVSPGRKRTGS